jgi:hypothetical protein
MAAGVPAELHIFRHGDHGSGMGAGSAALDLWPVLLEQWLRDQGLLTPAPKTVSEQVVTGLLSQRLQIFCALFDGPQEMALPS